MIEPATVPEAAKHITPSDIQHLKQLLMEERRLMGERGQSARRAEIKASGDFHLMLQTVVFMNNAVLQRFMNELVARSSLVIALHGQSAISSCGHHEHGM